MTEHAALIAAIRENPDDDTPRLVFADWLDEHDEPDRAEFIRVECELARTPDSSKRWKHLNTRAEKLFDAHTEEWAGPLAQPGVVEDYHTRRGFINLIELSAAQFARHAGTIFAHAPIADEVFLTARAQWGACFARSEWSRVRSLGVNDEVMTPAALPRLVTSPHLTNLRELDLGFNPIGTAGGQRLRAWPHLGKLERLQLLDCGIGLHGAASVLAGLWGGRVRELGLAGNDLGDDAIGLLASSPLPELRTLHLHDNNITATGVVKLLAAAFASQLTELNLHSNPIGDVAAELLLDSPNLTNLRKLNVGPNGISKAMFARIRKRFGQAVED